MSKVAAQAYLHTRVSIMATGLFKPDLIARLTGYGLPELAEHFELTQLVDGQLSTQAKSRAVEQGLIETLLSELTTLVRPMSPIERALVISWARKFALVNLKTLIRGKLYELERPAIRENLYDLPANVRLPDRDELFRAENVLELLRQLERGPYRLIARQAREIYEKHREPFALEATLDQRYYAAIARLVQQFNDHNLASLRDLVGAILDRIDLLWLLRFRLSYRLSASETFYQLVPSFKLMHRDRLLKLVNLESLDDILAGVPNPLGARLVGRTNLVEIEQHLSAHLADVARRILARSESGVARTLAYLILRERDLAILFSLIQGRLLELPDALVKTAVDPAHAARSFGGLAAAA